MTQDSAVECVYLTPNFSVPGLFQNFFFPGNFTPFGAFWPPNTLLADAVRVGSEDEISKTEGKNLRLNLLRAVK